MAEPVIPVPKKLTDPGEKIIKQFELNNPQGLERFEPETFWPPHLKFCGMKEGCYEIHFTPKSFATSPAALFRSKYKGTMRVERNGQAHTISGDLYKFREYLHKLEHLGIPRKVTAKWQNEIWTPGLGGYLEYKKKKCPIYARNKYHSYLKGTSVLYDWLTYADKCSYTLNFDQYFYTHPASGFDGDFGASADRSIRMEIVESSSDNYTGTVYSGAINLGTVKIWWRSKYFRTAHLEVFTLEGAEHPPTTVPDGSGGAESFETVFETAGWKLYVTRNSTKVPLPASLSGLDINGCWDWDDLHDVMDSTPGYDNTELDSKWRVFLISVPAKLGCSRGVVFDQTTGDVNSVDREGSATYSHDGFNGKDEYGAAKDELMKDHPRGFLRSAAHEVGHAFNQYHQPTQNSIMCPTPDVADAIDAAGGTFPDDIDLAFNETIRHKLIHQPDPAVRPGAMDWSAAFGVPEADDVNFYDSDDLHLEVDTNKENICIGEPIEVDWKLTNKMGVPVRVPGHIGAGEHNVRISVTAPTGETHFMRMPLNAHDASHEPIALAPGKSISEETLLFWTRSGFAFEQPGRHKVNVMVIWEDEGVFFAVEGFTTVWVNYPISDRDNEIAALMMNEDVGRFILTGKKQKYPEGAKRIETIISKHKNHDVSKTMARLPGHKYSKKPGGKK